MIEDGGKGRLVIHNQSTLLASASENELFLLNFNPFDCSVHLCAAT